ncbi:hypothetical protein ROS217_10152 [Roseovarius sp. 217]|nr:hypothetical protein ROS217_10152 [Roseovarius sp. 217]
MLRRTQDFELWSSNREKCCAVHQWLDWRSCAAAIGQLAKVQSGPTVFLQIHQRLFFWVTFPNAHIAPAERCNFPPYRHPYGSDTGQGAEAQRYGVFDCG